MCCWKVGGQTDISVCLPLCLGGWSENYATYLTYSPKLSQQSKNCKEVLVTFFFYKGWEGLEKTVGYCYEKSALDTTMCASLCLEKLQVNIPDIGVKREEYHIIL